MVRAGVPSRLVDLPGSPLACSWRGRHRVRDLDTVVTVERSGGGVDSGSYRRQVREGDYWVERQAARHVIQAYVTIRKKVGDLLKLTGADFGQSMVFSFLSYVYFQVV